MHRTTDNVSMQRTVDLALGCALLAAAVAGVAGCSGSSEQAAPPGAGATSGAAGADGGSGAGGTAGSAGTAGAGASAGTAGNAGAAGTAGSGASGGAGGAAGSAGAGGSAGSAGAAGTAGSGGKGPGSVLAVNRLFLGDTDRQGNVVPTAWKSFGLNIDGLVSDKTSTNVCKRQTGASTSVQVDGDNGIDNSFGANLVPLFLAMQPDMSMQVNTTILQGGFTFILSIEELGTGTNYPDLAAAFYSGSKLAHQPVWDGTDEWPLKCEFLEVCLDTGTPPAPGNKSKMLFPHSNVAQGVWSSGTSTTVMLPFYVFGYPFPLIVYKASATAKLGTESPAPTSATEGTLGGVFDTEEFVASMKKVAGNLSTTLCDGATWESIAQQIRAASDIMKDGTQDPNATCDGISVGLGFNMKVVKLGATENKGQPPPDPCK